MKKFLQSKAAVILLAMGGLLALALLSAALRDFTFRPSEPFSFNFGGLPVMARSGTAIEIPLWKILLFSGLLLTIFVIILLLLDPEVRKRLLLRLLRFVLTMLGIWMLMNYAYERGNLQQVLNLIPAAGAGTSSATQSNAAVYVPPQISPWLVFAVSFGVALVLVLIGWFFYTHQPKPRAALALDEIAEIACDALDGLQDGHNWDDAIVRCYIRMSTVVTTERGLIRQPGSTPAEFAQRMERAGLPGEAVRTLTRLFEGVRYGGKISSLAERDLAAAALGAIVHACGVDA